MHMSKNQQSNNRSIMWTTFTVCICFHYLLMYLHVGFRIYDILLKRQKITDNNLGANIMVRLLK